MGRVITATEARVRFGELLRSVAEGREPVVVERGGKAQAVILSVAEYDRLRGAYRGDWLERVDRVRARIGQRRGRKKLPPAEDIIRQARGERDADLARLR